MHHFFSERDEYECIDIGQDGPRAVFGEARLGLKRREEVLWLLCPEYEKHNFPLKNSSLIYMEFVF